MGKKQTTVEEFNQAFKYADQEIKKIKDVVLKTKSGKKYIVSLEKVRKSKKHYAALMEEKRGMVYYGIINRTNNL